MLKIKNKYHQIQVIGMILAMLITVSMAQLRTSTNTCTNEKTIFKLDIRQRVQNLPPNSTINDLNASALCEEAYLYDYIWLTQLWTPGRYNYKNVNGEPQQTSDDYRELLNIQEYIIDPSLGSQTDLYFFQNNIRTNCPHMKFLGEFSFYVSKDSYLVQNISRFLRRPLNDNYNSYNQRYDNQNFAWAVNDQMKTIPNALPWNYFNPIVINDMKDIIYRVIIDQHKLDGIVFLQPSLGLYSVMNQIFQPEIKFYGVSSFLQDFYQSLGLKQNSQTLFFMGGEDNSNSKIILQNYLQQIHGSPISNTWADMNYTFYILTSQTTQIDDKTVQGKQTGVYGNAKIQFPPANPPTCMQFQIIAEQGARVGISNKLTGSWTVTGNGTFFSYEDPLIAGSYSFKYYKSDIIEVQYDQSIDQFIFKKYSIDHTNYQQLSMMFGGGYNNLQLYVNLLNPGIMQVKFPFQFSQKYKHSSLVIQNSQQIAILTTPDYDYYQYAQIWPSINQNENIVTLNFKLSNLPSGRHVLIGVCNQEIVTTKGQRMHHQQILGSGAYVWKSNGQTHHSQSDTYNQLADINRQYIQGDIIGVSYIKSNQFILFYKNSVYNYQYPLTVKIKNLNFCAGLLNAGTVIDLVY